MDVILPVGLALYGLAAVAIPVLFLVNFGAVAEGAASLVAGVRAPLRAIRKRVSPADVWPFWTALASPDVYRGRHRA